jgi:short-subunit dehydrogenase
MLEDNQGRDKDGRAALVTGAGRGIGAAVARLLAAEGYAVTLVARTEVEVQEQVDAINAAGGRAQGLCVDLSEAGAAADIHRSAVDRFGAVDVLVNNAATVHPVDFLVQTSEPDWWRAFEVNVRASAELLRLVLPSMVDRGKGAVVGVSSLLAALPLPRVSAYCASKAAFEALHLAVAGEVLGRGVRINAFWPGVVDTVMQAEIRGEPLSVVGNRDSGLPMRTALEAARVIVELCRDDCVAHGLRVDIDDDDSMLAAGLGSSASVGAI